MLDDPPLAMMLLIPFAFVLLFVAYYSASERTRYLIARRLAEGLGGRAVFRLGRSQMRREQDGVEERVWIVPDDKMAWGSLLSVLRPPAGMLFLQRAANPGFRFEIEPQAGLLWRTISLGRLGYAEFHVPRLDERLRLRTDRPAEAAAHFSRPEAQHALLALFGAGFSRLKGEHGAVVVSMKGVSDDDLAPESVGRSLRHLRSL